jgi:hypothetical protein
VKNYPCTYPIRDRNLTVSESYLNRLLQELNELNQRVDLSKCGSSTLSKDLTSRSTNLQSNLHSSASAYGQSVEDPTAEVFVSKLKELVSPILLQGFPESSSSTTSPTILDEPSFQQHNYVLLSFDRLSKFIC